jgi:hypothetical protein
VATQTDPRHTQNRDWRAVGQRERSHKMLIAQQHAATPTASSWLGLPCGPVGLQISVIETVLIPNMTSAMTRQVIR